MILQMFRTRRRQILLDVNTQRDFLLAGGRACIRNHRRVLAHIRRMMAWARSSDVPIISTCDLGADGHRLKSSSEGLKKIRYTLVDNHISFAADSNTDLPRDMLRRYQQVIFQKRCLDPFDEPRIDRVLSEIRAPEFILIGTSTEGAIQAAALGLLQRHKHVIVVVDAIGTYDPHEAKMALRKMEAKGAALVETKRIAGSSHLRHVGVCGCSACHRSTPTSPEES